VASKLAITDSNFTEFTHSAVTRQTQQNTTVLDSGSPAPLCEKLTLATKHNAPMSEDGWDTATGDSCKNLDTWTLWHMRVDRQTYRQIDIKSGWFTSFRSILYSAISCNGNQKWTLLSDYTST